MSRARRTSVLILLLVGLTIATFGGVQSPAASAGSGQGLPAYVPGELLIKFQPGARALDRAAAQAQLNATRLRTFTGGAEHWRLGPGVGVEQAMERMKRNPLVTYAEPNYVLTADVTPNDPRYPELYAMNNTGQTGGTPDADIDADMAWGVSRGSRSVVVGIIDTGVDYNHPDLAANIWANPGEIPGNGIDDDGNGFVDDVHGYDFINNDGDPFDDNGHGTHVAGTIGAVGNNGTGVVGVNWEVTIMALKFLSAGGSGSTADAVRACDYATMMHVALTSNSWGGGGFSQTLYDAIARAGAAEIPFIAAAGNDGVNNDTSPHYPSSYTLPNIISVAATDHNDAVASFSNYGAVSVDIAAPGVNILSTQPGNRYQLLSGTSMATPHVAGAAALVKSLFPNIPVAQLKTALMVSADQKPQLNPTTGTRPVASGGRLNAFFAIAAPDDVPPGSVNDLATNNAGSNTMGLSWTATGDDGGTGTATFYQVRYSTSPIDEGNFNAAARAGNEPDPLPAGSAQSMEVRGLSASTGYYFAIKAFDEFGNPGPISNLAPGTTLPPPTVGLTPTSISEALFTGQTADHTIMLRNDGVGTLDFTIPTPFLSSPMAAPQPPLLLDKGEPDPRSGDPVTQGAGGPDPFGYRWVDSDQPGGPAFGWIEISGTGAPVAGTTADDSTSAPIPLGFNIPFYGTFFSSVRASSNGFLSFTSSSTAYSNQPLPSGGAPENLVAPFWDDLDPGGATHVYFQSFGTRAVIEWYAMPRYQESGSALTFEAILDADGTITYQYLTLTGTLNSATVGIQNATQTVALQTVFNQNYLHDNLAVRYSFLPQWLTVAPTSGRIPAGGSIALNAHIDASGLEGGTYPGQIVIQNNDPNNPAPAVDVTLVVTGAPDAVVQPASLAYGDRFLGLPHDLTLTVANQGTDVLHVSGIGSNNPDIVPTPASFDVAPHASQNVNVRWTPSALGPMSSTLTVSSDDAGEPNILVPVTGNAIPAPVVVLNPTSFTETLFSGQTSTQTLTVSNAGGSNLILTAAADQGNGATGTNGYVVADATPLGNGGPDAFGYRWRDSDAAGGPTFNFVDISTTGTPITISGDDSLSTSINMGMTFPFYGTNFTTVKVCTNGFVTFDPNNTVCPFTNGSLPSTSLPRSSVALFWDDLDFRGVQKARYLNDGTRFIIQYTDVDRHQSPTGNSHLTFQVQLYPSGRILAMYQTMTSTTTPALDSATIGIQNQARNIALQVVNNAAYMHGNLALQYSRTPDWLTVTPSGATIPPGGSQDFTVGFNSTDRLGGQLNGNLVLGTNIPGQGTVMVPATLNVIGAPRVGTVPTSFNYGTVFIGYPQLTTFEVVNNGTADLNVSDIDTTDPSLTVESTPGPTVAFPLPPGGSRVFNLRWSPTAVGPLNAQVRVHSDDPVTPTASIAVTGNAILPPVAMTSPASFTESLNAGDIVTRNLHIENQGGSDLTFSTSVRSLGGSPVTQYPELDLKKDEPDPRPGILGSGGPDLFGYRWKDSDEPGGPTFAWTDITGVGTPITALTSDDQNAGPFPIGFNFPFYGGTFSSVRVCTNGWLSFTSTSTDLSNNPLPNTGEPENLLAAFWDDLHFRGAVHAYYYNDGSRFIVQYNNVDRFSTTELPSPAHLTFQVILYPNGRIVYQYLTMSGFTTSATIGMQNATRNDGLTVVFNAAYVHDNLAVEFRQPVDFLSVSPSSGTIPAGGSADLQVRIDASNLIGGDYPASVDLLTNDPARGLIATPVSLHVTGIPDVDLLPGSLTFPMTYLGFSSTRSFNIRNAGTDVLHVTAIGSSGDFTASGPSVPFDLPVGGSVPVSVLFTPTVPGLRAGDVTVTSDDPDEGTATVHVEGEALIPPEIGMAPGSISTALPPGGARTKTLTLTNSGGSDLVWTTGTNTVSTVTPGTFVALGKNDVDYRLGFLGNGGPDAFGYYWTDSDEPGGPVFAWTDISGIGTAISSLTADDAIALNIPIGFPFSYYGNTFSTVNVHTNGWLSFTNTTASGSATYTNQPLPNNGTGVPENLLALFWDDLHFRSAVHAYYYNDGTRFIVQYNDVDRFSSDPPSPAHLTFQAILYPSGKIVYQYLTMNGVLTSATVGIQNAARDDGLTVVFNAAYMHDNLAIELKPWPDWMRISPTGGTVPAGGSQTLTVSLNAAGLDDGLHEGTIDVSSNDPYEPMMHVPVSLNVSLVAPTMFDFDPDVLNLQSNGQYVKIVLELPAGLDPHRIDLSSLRLNDTVGLPPNPIAPSFGDSDGNGIEEITLHFDRLAVEMLFSSMPAGNATLTIQGEVADVQWFRGSTTVRTFRPREIEPMGGEYFVAGDPMTISWTPPSGLPVNARYAIQLTRDGGSSWEAIASNLTATSYTWTVGGAPTSQARVRVIVVDNQGVMGYGTSDGDFTIATSLMPPNDVGGTLDVFASGSDVVLKWARPATDVAPGPVAFSRICRSPSAAGPFVEIGTATTESYADPLAGTSGAEFVYYKVLAANSGGNSLD